jgi:hypothetical protein
LDRKRSKGARPFAETKNLCRAGPICRPPEGQPSYKRRNSTRGTNELPNAGACRRRSRRPAAGVDISLGVGDQLGPLGVEPAGPGAGPAPGHAEAGNGLGRLPPTHRVRQSKPLWAGLVAVSERSVP